MKPSILFIGKKGDFYCERAVDFIKTHFPKNEIILGCRGEEFPRNQNLIEIDYIISYLSPWVIPEKLLGKVKKASINFHPGPPEYPGIGCTNFAIYNNADTFGVTCHYMFPKVDTGKIIAVKRFQLYKNDTVYTLTHRCYGYILQLFYEIVSLIILNDELPHSKEHWTREPYKRRELNELCRITADMSDNEVIRRVKAVTYPNAPGAYIEIAGMKFNYDINNCN